MRTHTTLRNTHAVGVRYGYVDNQGVLSPIALMVWLSRKSDRGRREGTAPQRVSTTRASTASPAMDPGKIHCPSEHQTQGARRRLQHRGLQWGRCRGSERSQRWRYSNLSDSLQLSRKVGLWRRPRGSVTAAAGSRAAQAAAATGGQRNTLCHCSPGPLGGRWLRTARSTVPSTTAIFETTDCRSGSGQGRYSGRGHRYGASTTPASL